MSAVAPPPLPRIDASSTRQPRDKFVGKKGKDWLNKKTCRHLRPRRFEGSVEVKEDELASVKVERQDFLLAVQEVVPAFGASTELVRGRTLPVLANKSKLPLIERWTNMVHSAFCRFLNANSDFIFSRYQLEECVGNGIVQWGEPVQRVLEDGEVRWGRRVRFIDL